MRLIFIIEDGGSRLEIGKPRVEVVELKGKNAVVVDFPALPRLAGLKIKNFQNLTLNNRQESFLNFWSKKSVTNREYRHFFKNKISTETARQDLVSLIKKGIFTRIGQRKSSIYQVREQFSEKS